MRVAVVAAGELPLNSLSALRAELGEPDHVIAADGGLDHCRDIGLKPDLVVGDFDSVDRNELGRVANLGVAVETHPTAKDATDLEIALGHAVRLGADNIDVVAIFGGRLDHELAAVSILASMASPSLTLRALDGRRSIQALRGPSTTSIEIGVDRTFSVIPALGDAIGVSVDGARWPLRDEVLRVAQARGVSNVATAASITVSVRDGVVLVVVDRGAD